MFFKMYSSKNLQRKKKITTIIALLMVAALVLSQFALFIGN